MPFAKWEATRQTRKSTDATVCKNKTYSNIMKAS